MKSYSILGLKTLVTISNFPRLHELLTCNTSLEGKTILNKWLNSIEAKTFFSDWALSVFDSENPLESFDEGEVILLEDNDKVISLMTSNAIEEALKKQGGEGPSIYSSMSVNTLLGLFGHGIFEYERYKFQAKDFTVYEEGLELSLQNDGVINHGEVASIDAVGEVVSYKHIDSADNRFIVVKISYKNEACPIRWDFSSKTLKSVGVKAADSNDHRYIFTMQLFEEFNYKDGIDVIELIFEESSSHFVRWEAVRCLIKLDRDCGMDILQKALVDEHIHVRNAARKTLDNIRKQGL